MMPNKAYIPICKAFLCAVTWLLTWSTPEAFAATPQDEGPVLSLIVNIAPAEALQKSIGQLCKVMKLQRIPAGEVMIIGYRRQRDFENDHYRSKYGIPSDFQFPLAEKDFHAQFSRRGRSDTSNFRGRGRVGNQVPTDEGPLTSRLLRQLELEPVGSVSTAEVLAHYKLARSPAWIVHYRGADHIFEGSVHPSTLFTSDGDFRESSRQSPHIKGFFAGYLTDSNRPTVNHSRGYPGGPSLQVAPDDEESVFEVRCK